MNFRETVDEICQVIYYYKWMASCVLNFHRKTQPLMEIVKAAYKIAGKRKNSAPKEMVFFKVSWGASHEAASIYLVNIEKMLLKSHIQEKKSSYPYLQMLTILSWQE